MKNQRGAIELIIIGVVAVLLAAGAGYYIYTKRTGASPVAGLAPVKCDYSDKDLCKFLTNFKAQKYYTVKSSSVEEGVTNEFTLKINGDDKSQTISSANGKENFNVITLGNTTYTKDYSDNKWWKQTQEKQKDEIKDSVAFDPDGEKKEGEQTEPEKPEYKRLGEEACGKLTCIKYQVITKGSEDQEFIWIDDDDHLLRKTLTITKDGAKNTAEYSYEKFKISAPSPVKEGAPSFAPANLPQSAPAEDTSQQSAEEAPQE